MRVSFALALAAALALGACDDRGDGPRSRALPRVTAHPDDAGPNADAGSGADAGVADDAGVAEGAPPPNNFAGFKKWNMENGLRGGMRVWSKRIVGSPTVRIQITLPVGSAQDFSDCDGLAHIVEHMVLASAGSEKSAFERASIHGGHAEASTGSYSTIFFIDVPSTDWAYGLRWMYDLLFGHRFNTSTLSRVRETIIAEGDVTPISDSTNWLFFPESLGYPDWFEREFGFSRSGGSFGTYESLHHISEMTTEAFHSIYYVPDNMLLTIIGDVPEEETWGLAYRLFSAIFVPDTSSIPGRHRKAVDPSRYRKEIGYREGTALVDVRLRYKLYDVTAEDVLMSEFLINVIRRETLDRIRFKLGAAYSVDGSVELFAGHAMLTVGSDLLPKKSDEAHRMIGTAVADVCSGSLGQDRFRALKKHVVDDLLFNTQSPESLSVWVQYFRENRQFAEFPDMVAFYEKINQPSVTDFCKRRLVRERLVETVIRPMRGATSIAIALSLAFILFALGIRRLVVKPAQMARLRYAARFRFSIAYLTLGFLTAALLYEFLEEAATVVYIQLLITHLESWDCEAGRKAIELSVLYGPLLLVLLVALMFIPRKILLFEHEWRVKFWLWRSKVYRYEDVREIREERLWSLLFSRRVFTTCVLHWGLWRKGLYLRTGKRLGWFFRARDNAELTRMLELAKRGWATEEPAEVRGAAPAE